MSKIDTKIILIGVLAFVFQLVFPQYSLAYTISPEVRAQNSILAVANLDEPIIFASGEAINLADPSLPESQRRRPRKKVRVVVTAYSSTVDQCDGDPFTTANGTKVRDGIVAANFLPFGAKIKLPALFGDKVFSVEDRMNSRYNYNLDIWFPTREEAQKFGVKYAEVEIY